MTSTIKRATPKVVRRQRFRQTDRQIQGGVAVSGFEFSGHAFSLSPFQRGETSGSPTNYKLLEVDNHNY